MKKNLAAFAFGLGLVAVLFLITEGVLGIVMERTVEIKESVKKVGNLKQVSVTQKFRELPDHHWKATFDQHDFRRIPALHKSIADKFNVAIAGCSYAMGWGLNDEDTLSRILEAKHGRQFQFYNFGLFGGGPHTFLEKLRETNLAEEFRGEHLELIYILIDDQILRAAGKFSMAGAPEGPHYEVENGQLTDKGSWVVFPFDYIYDFFLESNLFDALGLRFQEKISQRDIDRTCAIFRAIKKEFVNKGVEVNASLIFYPGATESLRVRDCIHDDYLIQDLSGLFNLNDPDYMIPGDGHPNTRAQTLLAREIEKERIQIYNF